MTRPTSRLTNAEIQAALERAEYHCARTAEMLGVTQNVLRTRLRKMGINLGRGGCGDRRAKSPAAVAQHAAQQRILSRANARIDADTHWDPQAAPATPVELRQRYERMLAEGRAVRSVICSVEVLSALPAGSYRGRPTFNARLALGPGMSPDHLREVLDLGCQLMNSEGYRPILPVAIDHLEDEE